MVIVTNFCTVIWYSVLHNVFKIVAMKCIVSFYGDQLKVLKYHPLLPDKISDINNNEIKNECGLEFLMRKSNPILPEPASMRGFIRLRWQYCFFYRTVFDNFWVVDFWMLMGLIWQFFKENLQYCLRWNKFCIRI